MCEFWSTLTFSVPSPSLNILRVTFKSFKQITSLYWPTNFIFLFLFFNRLRACVYRVECWPGINNNTSDYGCVNTRIVFRLKVVQRELSINSLWVKTVKLAVYLKHPGLCGVLEIDDIGDYQKFPLKNGPSRAPVVSSGLGAVTLGILRVKRWTLYVMNARESKLCRSQLADNYLNTLPEHTYHENTIHLYRIIILSFSLQYPTMIFMSLTYHYISISH